MHGYENGYEKLKALGCLLIHNGTISMNERRLMNALYNIDSERIEQLLQQGEDVNQVNDRGESALLYASANGYHWIVESLLKAGADVALVDTLGATALLHASINGHTHIVKMLLENGADIHHTDARGWTALQYASLYKHKDVMIMLLQITKG